MAPDPGDEQGRLDRLVRSLHAAGGVGAVGPSCHRAVPGVDGVVLSVDAAYAGWMILSESGPHGDQLEDLHAVLGEGPGVDAAVTGAPVTAPDLGDPIARARWPRFTQQAPERGIGAVFAFPLLLHDKPFGVLSAYRSVAGPLDPADDQQMRRYARAVTLTLLDDAYITGDGALDLALPVSAGEVQQAVGVVMEHHGVDAATALHRLRDHARRSRRPMRDVVAEVRANRLPFGPTERP